MRNRNPNWFYKEAKRVWTKEWHYLTLDYLRFGISSRCTFLLFPVTSHNLLLRLEIAESTRNGQMVALPGTRNQP